MQPDGSTAITIANATITNIRIVKPLKTIP
jgi:hypothetical protein